MAIAVGPDLTFSDTVRERSGEDVHGCFYCQKCTIGCPTAYVMDYKPAQLLRLIQMGQKDRVLGSSAIWLCVGCETCGTRCPNRIRLAPVMDALRHLALEGEYVPEPSVYALHRSFLDSIRLWGRVHELSMIAQYKLRAPFGSDLRADIKVALYLLLKGKIFSLPERVRGLAQVRGFFAGPKGHSETEVGQ